MPTYSYSCRNCEHRFDIQQAFSDDALTTCPECGGSLRKVYGNVGVVFKGSGFYRTDSRSTSSASVSSDSSASKDSSGSSSSSGSDSSADKASKPATDSKPASTSKSASKPA